MELKLTETLLAKGLDWFGVEILPELIVFQPTRKDVPGDTTLMVFPLAKVLKMTPAEAAEKIGSCLQKELLEVDSYQVIQGFLNLSFSKAYWLKVLRDLDVSQDFGRSIAGSKGLMMVEYSSPNTNKPLHLGHLRNIFLGYSVAELLKAVGHKVIKTQVINDRGIHICKSMLAWQRFSPLNEKGEKETPMNTGLKGDKLVGKYYVEFDKHLNQEAKTIMTEWEQGLFDGYHPDLQAKVLEFQNAALGKDEKAQSAIQDKIKELAKNETAILRDAKEMLIQWEARDPQVYLLWATMNAWVYEGFESTYQRMGVDFDKLYYESDTFLLGKDSIMSGLKQGLFYQKNDGSVWIDLSADGLDEKLVLRSDGTAVYMTQDIGTAIDRYKDFPDLSGMVYTVGNEQDYHFKVLFLILKKLGYSWAEHCYHLSYGMVDLPTGKMKSREGTVVDADDIMQEVVDAAEAITQERGHIADMSPQERTALFEQIGMGGLKYFLLKVDPKKRMLFNPEESIDLTGHTGPFIQYAHARIQSLIAKAGERSTWCAELKMESPEIGLIKIMQQYPECLNQAAQSYSPALLANYLYELTKAFNSFYQQCSILNESDQELKTARLLLTLNIGKILASGLNILGINAPQKM